MQWIEQAEASQFLRQALFERVSTPSLATAMRRSLARRVRRICWQLVPAMPEIWPTFQAVPALVRRPQRGRIRDDGDYPCLW